jgi:hypothetical protein
VENDQIHGLVLYNMSRTFPEPWRNILLGFAEPIQRERNEDQEQNERLLWVRQMTGKYGSHDKGKVKEVKEIKKKDKRKKAKGDDDDETDSQDHDANTELEEDLGYLWTAFLGNLFAVLDDELAEVLRQLYEPLIERTLEIVVELIADE